MTVTNKWLNHLIHKQNHIAPLAIFRIIFGLMILISTLRFILKGWVEDLYITPSYYFTYYGFDWISPISPEFIYLLFGILIITSILIIFGLFYRLNISLFFLAFTYIELIDKTNYLNHYYFISLLSFILIFLPLNKYFSLDTFFGLTKRIKTVPVWTINVIKIQLAFVYVFAGIAKLNYHWLIEAQPLINWLKHMSDFPIIGEILLYDSTAYLFSWFGALFDLSIIFILINNKLRIYGYILVLIFHITTSIMFPIGVFPLVMIASTLIFFGDNFHQKIIATISKLFYFIKKKNSDTHPFTINTKTKNLLKITFILFFSIQLFLPLRYLLYPGKLFWTEQGYRFSWRVMLIEKAGYAQFFLHEPNKDRKIPINNKKFLTPQQEKMMSTQPDMILQYAHFLSEFYKNSTFNESNGELIKLDDRPKITAKVEVGLFNKGSRPFINENVDLATINRGFKHKNWVLPYEN